MSDLTHDLTVPDLTSFTAPITLRPWGTFELPRITKVDATLSFGAFPWPVAPRHFDLIVDLYGGRHYTSDRDQVYVRHCLRDAETLEALGDLHALEGLVELINTYRAYARNVLVHCQAGINRSGLVTARVLCAGPNPIPPETAIQRLRVLRHPAVLSNRTFERFVLSPSF